MNRSHIPALVTLTGPSATGKSSLLAILRAHPLQYSTHVQGTTRARREADDWDVRTFTSLSPVTYEFIYHSAGYDYGIETTQIDGAHVRGLDHVLVCNDLRTIALLRSRYGRGAVSAFLDSDLDEAKWRRLQHRRGMTLLDIECRWYETQMLRRFKQDQPTFFHGAILNGFGQPPEMMLPQFEMIVQFGKVRSGTDPG